jgi:hypothetical protein
LNDRHRVFVYRNPDPHSAKFAIRDLASGVVTVLDEVWLADAVFEVSPSGRYRSMLGHRRTVHAGVFGTLLDAPPRGPRCEVAVCYKPAECPFFLNEEYRPVHKARLVHLVRGKAYVPREARWL